MSKLRLGFAGTPEFAATLLSGLITQDRTPQVVYTQPDRPQGRGRRLRASAVKDVALAHGLPVQQPESLRAPDVAQALAQYDLDVLVVAAYGLLLPQPVLDTPRFGCINVHASLLPRWRGAAPVERAILSGDLTTGVSIMRMERGLDTGPVYLTRECAIGPTTTGPELESRLATLGTEALLTCLDALPDLVPVPQQPLGACYAQKLTPVDARIDWSATVATVDRQVRALCARMPAFTFANGVRVQVLEASPLAPGAPSGSPGTIVAASARQGIVVACGDAALAVRRLQLNRGRGLPLTAADALNGYPDLIRVGGRLHDGPG